MGHIQKIIFVVLCLLILQNDLLAQSFQPYIKAYQQEEYSSDDVATSPQNWDIVQDNQGLIYIGNTNGIFEFDGHTWSIIPQSNNFVTKLLSLNHAGYIYASSEDGMGRVKLDSNGHKYFENITDSLLQADIQTDFRWQFKLGDDILFATRNSLLIWNGSKFIQHKIRGDIKSIAANGQTVLLQIANDSLRLFEKNRLINVEGLERIDAQLIGGLKTANGRSFFITNDGSFLELEGHKLKKLPQKVSLDATFTNCLLLPRELIALGTDGGGLLIINKEGQILSQLTTESGLADNTITEMFLDREQGLWLAHSNGLSRVELFNALSLFSLKEGLAGTVTSISITPEKLWVATLKNIYYSNQKTNPSFKRISNDLLEGWKVFQDQDVVLSATSSGILEISNSGVRTITEGKYYCLAQSRQHPDIIYVGMDDGIGLLQKREGQWEWLGKKVSTDSRIFTIAEAPDGRVWACEDEIYTFSLNDTTATDIKKLKLDYLGLNPDRYNVFDLNVVYGRFFIGSGKGVLEYDPEQEKLIASPEFDLSAISLEPEVYYIKEDGAGTVWLTEKNKVIQMARDEEGIYKPVKENMVVLPAVDIHSLTVDSSGTVWIGTAKGLFRYNPKISDAAKTKPLPIIIRDITINDTLSVPLGEEKTERSFPIKQGNFIFTFLSPTYKSGNRILYSYKLEGFDEDWSNWNPKGEKEYTNLPEGEYTFLVRARNSYGLESDAREFSFIILPPFYRTWWAYLFYLLFGLCVIWMAIYLNAKRHQRQLSKKKEELRHEQEINARLRQTDKLKDEFLANTSHELRTPLMGIIGMAESLKDAASLKENSEVKSDLSLIASSGRRLSNLVNSILDYSRLKEHDLKLSLGAIDLSIMVSVVLRINKSLASSKNLELYNNVPADLPPVSADENRLQQILHNLVGNAIKFTDSGKVEVSARVNNEEIEVSVKDSGIGIAPDKHDLIFQSFEQLDASETREFGGTGLGLTITKKLVELHGGKIWLLSEPGNGAEFLFTLPVSHQALKENEQVKQSLMESEEDDFATDSVKPPPHTDISSGIKILIVDDEKINQQVLQHYLSAEHYHVILASNGPEALEIVSNEENLDLVLLDIMMPRMSGYEVCKKIREKYLPSELPIIFITAKNQIKDLVQGFSRGGNDYLVKPFSKQEFLARVKTHINLLHINSAYQRFVPKEFIRTLGKENIIDVHLGDQVSGEMTVMFSDIRDYTSILEQLTPAESFEFLNLYLARVGPIITKNNGFVEHFYGDGIMALFPGHSEDALLTAIQMQQALLGFTFDHIKLRHPLKMGVGMHRGPLMLGILGHSQRMDTGVVSDTVNTASRIEGMNKYFGVNILTSESTLKNVPDFERFSQRFLGKVRLKGKTEVINLHEIYQGDEPNIVNLKDKTLEDFNAAMEAYYNKKFTASAGYFEKVLKVNPKDMPSQIYLRLCQKYLSQDVEEEWTGIETMDVK